MSTAILSLEPITVTASAAGEAIPLTAVLTGIPTYYVSITNTGSYDAYVWPPGTTPTGASSKRVKVAGTAVSFGPFRVSDGDYVLYASANSDCIVDIEMVVGE